MREDGMVWYGHGMHEVVLLEAELGERVALAIDDADTWGDVGWYYDADYFWKRHG